MGSVARDSRARINFKVLNDGSMAVRVSRVLANCGCTVARIDRPVVAPGGSATVYVVFRSRGYWREVEKKVYIFSDDANHPVRTVRIFGYVRTGAQLDARTVNLGAGRFTEELGPKRLHLFADAGVQEGKPHLVGGGPRLSMLAGKWKSVDAGRAQRCTLWIREERITQFPGTYSRTAFVAVGRGVRLPLRVLYTVRPVVSSDPAEVVLGHSATGPARTFLNCRGRHVDIDSISSVSGYCTARLAGAGTPGPELCISRTASGRRLKATEVDVIHVEYALDGGIRREVLSIPVVLER